MADTLRPDAPEREPWRRGVGSRHVARDVGVERFIASYDSVLYFAAISTALGFLNAAQNGWDRGGPGAVGRGLHHLALALLRIRLERMEDKALAHRIFSWGAVLATVLLTQGLLFAQIYGPVISNVSVAGAVFTAAMAGLSSVYMRHLSIYAAPRAACIASTAFAAIASCRAGVAFSRLGHPDEAVLICACMLIGELVGHTLEVGWQLPTRPARSGSAVDEAAFANVPGGAVAAQKVLQEQLDAVLSQGAPPRRELRSGGPPLHSIGDGVGDGRYDVVGLIGRGGSSDVFLVSKKGELYAMKRVAKGRLKPHQLKLVAEEMAILRKMRHPFIVSLHATLESEKFIYMALHYAGGGDLSAWMEHLTPDRARVIVAEVLLGLSHIHAARVIYRDVKLENTLVALDGHIMLADFGASKRLLEEEGGSPGGGGAAHNGHASTSTMIGTPNYMSPEQWRGEGYSFEVDWWAMAVMLHEMLTGELVGVCRSREPTILLDQIADPQAADMIVAMLRWDVAERLGCGDSDGASIRAHPYVADHIDFDALLRKEVKGPLLLDDEEPATSGAVALADAAAADGLRARAPSSARRQSTSTSSSRPRTSRDFTE